MPVAYSPATPETPKCFMYPAEVREDAGDGKGAQQLYRQAAEHPAVGQEGACGPRWVNTQEVSCTP